MNPQEFRKISEYCIQNNRDFLVLRSGGSYAVIRRKFDSPELRAFIREPESAFKNAEIIKNSRTTKAALCDIGENLFFLKRYNNKGVGFTFRYIFRKARAFRAFRNAWIFEKLKIPTPKAIAAVSIRKNGIILEKAFLLCERINTPMDTLDFFRETLENREARNTFFIETAALLANAHSQGFTHGDLKMSNVFARKNEKGKYGFGFWDLDGMKYRTPPLSDKKRARDIARLLSSYIELGQRTGLKTDSDRIKQILKNSYDEFTGTSLSPATLDETLNLFLRKKNYGKNNESKRNLAAVE
jgi:hypothetical protein